MTLLPHISQQFKGAVWRIEIDQFRDILIAEIRNAEAKTVTFSSVSLDSGELNFQELSTPERWLTGIECIYDGVLLLHYYQSETGPAHKGLMAVDALTGEILWSNFTFGFDRLTADGPLVFDMLMQPRRLFLLDIRTGSTTRIYQPVINAGPVNYLRLPDQISAESLPSDLAAFHPYGNWVHYIEHNNFRIVSLHALKGGQLVQLIYVFNDDQCVYEDLLNADIQKIQPEAFIMHKNCLIYIKNKTELKVLPL
ncbi:MAG TPA: DUF4905 domain-containing protein [Mucilaginibacter sp.]|nr:DUF4905 domain-containing protein [Mucilaginibacter sp.]